mmetsp:Transcript_24395/g.36187  ORF Transcript_24395/g.36187 Transcript_24395/m.36187 type:complete len:295 (+) Transcript_24395:69-953(+)
MQRQRISNERATFKNSGKAVDEIASFGSYDVLFGRTRLSFNHFGNMRFRALIAENYHEFHISKSRNEKANVTNKIMRAVHDNGGKFLRFEGNEWLEVASKVAKRKIGHALRDFNNNLVAQDSSGINRHIAKQQLLEHNITKDVDSVVKMKPFPVHISNIQIFKDPLRKSGQDKGLIEHKKTVESRFHGINIQGRNLQIKEEVHPVCPFTSAIAVSEGSISNSCFIHEPNRESLIPESFSQETKVMGEDKSCAKKYILQSESINLCDESFIVEDVIPTPKSLLEPISDCDLNWLE